MIHGVVKYKEKTDSIRLRHKTLRGVMLVVNDRARPLSNGGRGRELCKVCKVMHTHKTYHLKLDDEGCVLVSTGIYDNIARMYDKAGFDIADVIHDPPSQVIAVEFVENKAVAHDPEPIVRRVNADGTQR